MKSNPNAAITISLPDRLHDMMKAFIASGWHVDENALITEALYRYLDSHREDILERQIRTDIEWGLTGDD